MYPVSDAEGKLEIVTDDFGTFGYASEPGSARLYVSLKQIQSLGLKPGDNLRGKVRPPRQDELYASFVLIEEVNGLVAQ